MCIFKNSPRLRCVALSAVALMLAAAPARAQQQPVEIKVGLSGTEVVVSVVDQGPGLTRAECASIFEPFTRGQGAGEGSGLGLAIARGFVELNGGRLWVESVPGRGATFSLALPAVEIDAKVPV